MTIPDLERLCQRTPISADFESLCGAFCDIAGIEPPALVADANGMLSATAHLRGVDVALVQLHAPEGDRVMLVATLGPINSRGSSMRVPCSDCTTRTQ
jgi:hypothetical protein